MLKRIVFLMIFFSGTVLAQNHSLDKIVAIVNDGVITQSELQNQTEQLRKQLEAKKMAMPEEIALKKQVLQHLIDLDLQIQLAKKNGIIIEDVELDNTIAKIAENNNITLAQLKDALKEQGIEWEKYKENIRKEILVTQLQQKTIAKNLPMVTEQQVQDYIKANGHVLDKNQQTYHVQNIVIPLPEEPTSKQLENAKAKASRLLTKINQGEDFSTLAMQESSGEFALEGGDLGERHLAELPEIFAKEVVRMKAGTIAGPLRTGNGYQLIKLVAIKGQTQQHIVNKTHVRHILLKHENMMTGLEAQKQANILYQQLQSGKDFALMAKQYSLDSATAIKGGDLGWVNPGELVPEFEKEMDSLAIKQVSKPVKSVFGWHLIQVLERKKVDDTEAFQKQQVRMFLQQRKFTEAVQNWQQHMRSIAYVNILDKELS